VPPTIRAADEAQRKAIVDAQSTGALIFSAVILISVVVATLISITGLFLFRRWSLWLNALLVAITPIIWFFVGYSVNSWVMSFLFEWVSIGLGAALAIAWFTPLRREFK
jgi:hypothetical protein